MYEQPTRRLGPAFLSGLAVLAVIAGVAGYAGTRQIIGGNNGNVGAARSSAPPTTANPGGPAGPVDPQDTGTPEPEPTTPTATGSATSPAVKCPDVTAKALRDAGLDDKLTLVLYVQLRRSRTSPAEAWVCKNATGTLFYQGHIRARPFIAATSDYSIVLGTGIKGEVTVQGSEFVAVNPEVDKTTEYHVSAASFTLVNIPGDSTTYEVVLAVTLPPVDHELKFLFDPACRPG